MGRLDRHWRLLQSVASAGRPGLSHPLAGEVETVTRARRVLRAGPHAPSRRVATPQPGASRAFARHRRGTGPWRGWFGVVATRASLRRHCRRGTGSEPWLSSTGSTLERSSRRTLRPTHAALTVRLADVPPWGSCDDRGRVFGPSDGRGRPGSVPGDPARRLRARRRLRRAVKIGRHDQGLRLRLARFPRASARNAA